MNCSRMKPFAHSRDWAVTGARRLLEDDDIFVMVSGSSQAKKLEIPNTEKDVARVLSM